MGEVIKGMKDKCAIYARVSSVGQREKRTIQAQLDTLPEVAKRNNWEIYDTYVDDGISGETVDARPEFQKLMDDAEDTKFNILLVIDLDRITRSKKSTEGALIYDHFRENDIKIATPSEIIDLQNEDQDFMAGIRREIAKWEKRKILKRTMRGKIAKLKRGVYVGGIVPFGYRWNGSKFEVDEEQAKIIKLIFDLCLRGLGSFSIVKYLNDRNMPTHSSILYKQLLERHKQNPKRHSEPTLKPVKWSRPSVRAILNRASYYTGKWSLNGFDDNPTLKLDPIITEEIFEKAQIEKQKRKLYERGDTRIKMNHERLCKGILVCGHCNRAMVGQYVWKKKYGKRYGKDKGFDYYVCNRKLNSTKGCDSGRIRVKQLDEEVWKQFIGMIKDPDKFEQMLRGQGYRADKDFIRDQIKALEIKLERNKNKRNKLAIAEVEAGEFGPQINKLKRESEVIQEQIHNLERQLFQKEETDENIKMAKEYFYRQLRYDLSKKLKHKESLRFFAGVICIRWNLEVLKEIGRLAFEEKRSLLRKFIDGINSKVVVYSQENGFRIDIRGSIRVPETPENTDEERLNIKKSCLGIKPVTL